MSAPLLEVRDLCAWYRRETPVLADLSLTLAEHEAVGLIGMNGAGKTTFLKVLSGLLPSWRAASLRFCGQPFHPRRSRPAAIPFLRRISPFVISPFGNIFPTFSRLTGKRRPT